MPCVLYALRTAWLCSVWHLPEAVVGKDTNCICIVDKFMNRRHHTFVAEELVESSVAVQLCAPHVRSLFWRTPAQLVQPVSGEGKGKCTRVKVNETKTKRLQNLGNNCTKEQRGGRSCHPVCPGGSFLFTLYQRIPIQTGLKRGQR